MNLSQKVIIYHSFNINCLIKNWHNLYPNPTPIDSSIWYFVILLLPVTSSANVNRAGWIFLGRCETAVLLRRYTIGFNSTETRARSCTLLLYIRIYHFGYDVLRCGAVSLSTRLVARFSWRSCSQLLSCPFLDRDLLVIRRRNLMRIAHPLRQMIVSSWTFNDTVDTLGRVWIFFLILLLRLPGSLLN